MHRALASKFITSMAVLGTSSARSASAGRWIMAFTPRARESACASTCPPQAAGSRSRAQYVLKLISTKGAKSLRCASRKDTQRSRYKRCSAPPSPSSWSENALNRQAPSASTRLQKRPHERSILSSRWKFLSQPPVAQAPADGSPVALSTRPAPPRAGASDAGVADLEAGMGAGIHRDEAVLSVSAGADDPKVDFGVGVVPDAPSANSFRENSS
mmetsp:Transcript_8558/g.23814  ORF Transcript_8558/g.23814 Transcript_8558/m.23814 type:complete len:214 (-) Transcript_8558:54-695(-)